MPSQRAAPGNSHVSGQGIEHMDTGEYVCRGICGIEPPHQVHAQVRPGECLRPELVAVWVQIRNGQEDRHPHAQVLDIRVVFLLIFVEKYKIDQRSGQKWEPQHIRHDEIFAEGDMVIDERMDDVVVMLDIFFQITECGHVENAIQQDDASMFIFHDGLYGRMDSAGYFIRRFVYGIQSFTFSFLVIYSAATRVMPCHHHNTSEACIQTGIEDFIIN